MVFLERGEMRVKFCAAGEEGSEALDTHTLSFLLLRDEIGLERGPNKDMPVVVCVQPKGPPRIEEAKKKSRHLLRCESSCASTSEKYSTHSNGATHHKIVVSECPRLVRELVY